MNPLRGSAVHADKGRALLRDAGGRVFGASTWAQRTPRDGAWRDRLDAAASPASAAWRELTSLLSQR